jgi:hypothetical protein
MREGILWEVIGSFQVGFETPYSDRPPTRDHPTNKGPSYKVGADLAFQHL